jgi:aminomethyltransferase
MAGDILRVTPLDGLNRALGAKCVNFAGWSMPVQFAGTLSEHRAAREGAALFDVSHMQQLWLRGPDAASCLEKLVPADILGLAQGRQRYGFLTNDNGGIIDDLMVSAWPDGLFVIVNAGRAAADIAHLTAKLPTGMLQIVQDRALLALQGPGAEAILTRFAPDAAKMRFMDVAGLTLAGGESWVSRSGYTGEDGFEISLPAAAAADFAQALIAAGAVPAGLAARDTLRLEAGLCLYGQDIDETTTPAEADLMWAIPKRRREAADFPGAAIILGQAAGKLTRKRVGFRPSGRAPVRAGSAIFAPNGSMVGQITSGGFGPTIGGPIAMGYAAISVARPGQAVTLALRGALVAAEIVPLPFVQNHFKR